MQTVDFSVYIITYNLIIGLLVMIASEKLGVYAGYVSGRYEKTATRITHTAALTIGACLAVLSAGIYIFGHLLKV